MKTRKPTNLKEQRGLTLIELIIVLVIVAIIGGVIAYALLGKTDDARANLSKTFIAEKIPEAYFSLISTRGPTNGNVTTDLQSRGVRPTNPFNGPWTATSANSTLTLDFTIPAGNNLANRQQLCRDIAAGLSVTEYPHITQANTANCGAATPVLRVVYAAVQ